MDVAPSANADEEDAGTRSDDRADQPPRSARTDEDRKEASRQQDGAFAGQREIGRIARVALLELDVERLLLLGRGLLLLLTLFRSLLGRAGDNFVEVVVAVVDVVVELADVAFVQAVVVWVSSGERRGSTGSLTFSRLRITR